VQDAKSSGSNEAVDGIRFLVVSDFSERPKTPILNNRISMIQIAKSVNDEDDVSLPSSRGKKIGNLAETIML
jgi:hypothetical protein